MSLPDTLQRLITSPPGQVLAGSVLAGIVWKFFEKVESVLNEQTKLEIAVWLVGVKLGGRVQPWPDSFAKTFDRVFGKKHLSWGCFARSCIATALSLGVISLVYYTLGDTSFLAVKYYTGVVLRPGIGWFVYMAVLCIPMNFVADYISLLETRLMIHLLLQTTNVWIVWLLLILDVALTTCTFCLGFVVSQQIATDWFPRALFANMLETDLQLGFVNVRIWHDLPYAFRFLGYPSVFLYASLLTSIWLWLYALSGFLLRAARRFDIGLQWFSHKVDIEKKPLS